MARLGSPSSGTKTARRCPEPSLATRFHYCRPRHEHWCCNDRLNPLDPAHAGSAFLDEIQYLQKNGFQLQGDRDGAVVTDTVGRLHALLSDLGVSLIKEVKDGGFKESTYITSTLSVRLISEYGSWRANLGYRRGRYFPASFWLEALNGSTSFPEPAVTEEDLDRLVVQLPHLVDQSGGLVTRVEAIGSAYRQAMKERLT